MRLNSEEKSLEFYKNFYDSYITMAPESIFISDAAGKIKEVNNAACQMLGFSKEEILNMNLFNFADENDLDKINQEICRIKKGEKILSEYYFYNKEKKKLILSMTCVRIDEDNYITYAKDITPSKKIANQMNFMLNSSIDGCIIVNYDGYIQNTNDSFCKMTGYAKEEIKTMHISNLIFNEPEDVLLKRTEYLKTKGSLRYENVYRKKDGSKLFVDVSINVINECDEQIFISFIRDITEKKKLEEDLRENQAILKAALDNSHAGIAIIDAPDGRFRYVNKAGLKIRGADEKYLVNEVTMNNYNVWNLYYLDEKEYKNEDTPISRALQNGEFISEELIIKRDSGENRIVWVNAAPIYDLSGKEIIAAIGIFLDVTERYNALEQAKQAKLIAEKANLAKSEFLLNISHELRTPLNGILGFSEMIMETLTDSENIEMLGYVIESGKRLLSIINNLIDISNLENKKEKIEYEIFTVQQVLNEADNIIDSFINNKNIKYIKETNIRPDKKFKSDIKKIIKILENALSNAFKFTEQGIVKLSITETADNRNTYLVIKVEDTGEGMKKEEFEKIYDLFWQGENLLTKKHSGLGVGLSIIKYFMDILKGEIKVESVLNQGSVFTFKIPVENIFEGCNISKTIYIADDDKINLKLFQVLCKKSSINVEIFENGNDLLNKIKETQKCDLVIMDIQMPKLDGFKTSEILRKDINYCKPIIGISAYANEDTRDKCLASGMNDFIEKPISISLFNQKITDFLN